MFQLFRSDPKLCCDIIIRNEFFRFTIQNAEKRQKSDMLCGFCKAASNEIPAD